MSNVIDASRRFGLERRKEMAPRIPAQSEAHRALQIAARVNRLLAES